MKRVIATGVLLALVACAGCGGRKIVAVSGKVTLDGKAYPNAIVSFQPMGTDTAPNVGRGSVGVTDKEGQFSLVYDNERPGALVGKHRVRICTKLGAEYDSEEGVTPAVIKRGQMVTVEPIPAEWHEFSTKTFTVPTGGTKEANFDIETPKTPPKKK